MKIVFISDTHNKHNKLSIPDGDLIIHAGDFTSRGYEPEVKNFLKWFCRLPHTYKIFIAGNHDLCFENKPEWLLELLANLPENVHYLENSYVDIWGLRFYGSPVSPSFHRQNGWVFNRDRGEEIIEEWKKINKKSDVVITHGPAFGMQDYTYNHEYVGCEDLRWFIKAIKPLLHLSGHIHEGYGIDYDMNTVYMNGCNCNLRYEIVNDPITLEINEYSKEIVKINNEPWVV